MDTSILIVVLCVVLVSCLLGLTVYRQRQVRLKKQILGLSLLQSMRVMLSCIQQHRGLTTGFLNGRNELLLEIENLQRQISRSIVDIVSINDWIEQQESWAGITQHWARLAGSYKQNLVDNNMIQHNALIQSLLHLIDDMAQNHDLLLLDSEHQNFQLSWRELLTAAEHIGQARALGMSISSLGYCDSIARIRMNYLCKKIQDNTLLVWKFIPPEKPQKEAVESLLQLIQQQLLLDRVDISPQAYFSVATTALDGLHDQYDRLVEQQRWQLKG